MRLESTLVFEVPESQIMYVYIFYNHVFITDDDTYH